jgi:hypothetical protein
VNVVVKIAQPPIEPRLTHRVDFDATDAEEWGRFAIKHNAWHVPCEIGMRSGSGYDYEVAVAIAAPDGRVAVWYGQATGPGPSYRRGKGFRRHDIAHCEAGLAVIGCRAAAAIWDGRLTRGGERDVTPLALAACRLLHARAFEYAPAPRDRLLAEFARLVGAERPPTAHVVKATDAALEAASLLLSIENYRAARALLAGKGAYEL